MLMRARVHARGGGQEEEKRETEDNVAVAVAVAGGSPEVTRVGTFDLAASNLFSPPPEGNVDRKTDSEDKHDVALLYTERNSLKSLCSPFSCFLERSPDTKEV